MRVTFCNTLYGLIHTLIHFRPHCVNIFMASFVWHSSFNRAQPVMIIFIYFRPSSFIGLRNLNRLGRVVAPSARAKRDDPSSWGCAEQPFLSGIHTVFRPYRDSGIVFLNNRTLLPKKNAKQLWSVAKATRFVPKGKPFVAGSSLFSVEWNFNAPRIRRLRGDAQLDAWNFLMRPGFSARARETAPPAGMMKYEGWMLKAGPFAYFVYFAVKSVSYHEIHKIRERVIQNGLGENF